MSTSGPISEVEVSRLPDGWTLRVIDDVASTNSYASRLPAWTAVRAIRQSAGRGRTDRRWVSDEGGLWLSAVVPCPSPRRQWEVLPLSAGWAVLGALRELGVPDPRLRWPNDIMVGRRKLAGLLVERFAADTAVIGIGINVFNHPEHADPQLAGLVARLADYVPTGYTVGGVSELVLGAIRRAHATMLGTGFGPIAEALNLAWSEPRRVEITLTGQSDPCEGLFHGIDERGRLRVSVPDGTLQVYDASQVALLRELS